MEKRVIYAKIIMKVGEYGIAKVMEESVWNNGKVFGRQIIYDVCLEHGDGDIVASFYKMRDAKKWAEEN